MVTGGCIPFHLINENLVLEVWHIGITLSVMQRGNVASGKIFK